MATVYCLGFYSTPGAINEHDVKQVMHPSTGVPIDRYSYLIPIREILIEQHRRINAISQAIAIYIVPSTHIISHNP
jgi:hypothetical protein